MKTIALIARVIVVAIIVLVVLRFVAHAQPTVLTPEIRKQTIEDLAALLPDRYAYKEIAPKVAQLLRQNLKDGKYDSYTSPLEFSLVVTRDLRSLNPDRHLALNHSPQAASPVAAQPASTPPLPEERARRASVFNRQMNFGFKQAQFLYGNIGYLKLDYFDSYLDYSRPVADASMAFFRNCDALIIDLRENGGGSGEMVNYLSGFFLKERTLVGSSYNRLTDSSSEEFIEPQPKEKQLGDIDLYVLTSRQTVSAAEALAYNLKYLRNAKVIGETSAGAANPGRVTRLNALFTAFIPNRHGRNAVTGTNWEGTGVPVDIAATADDALRTARLEALRKLRQKSTDHQQQQKLDNYTAYIEKAKSTSSTSFEAKMQYAGDYHGGRNVIIKDDRLVYSHEGVGGEMYQIAQDVFMMNKGDVTISFRRDQTGRVKEMVYQWSLSSDSTAARKTHN